MKQSIRIVFFIIFLACQNSFACLNYYHHSIDQDGIIHENGLGGFVGFNKNFNYRLIASKLSKFEVHFQASHSAYILSDYAVLLMKAGRAKESLELLIELNKNLPDEYQIAANLGTAYELNGELDSALFYIRRGIEINPNAHKGSEWVHIKVLETKKQQIENPNYLDSKTVLDLSEAQKSDSVTRSQLEIQIRERFPFTPAPDQIMGYLMIDLGDCYAKNLSIEYAKAFYNIAELYYGADSAVTTPKIKRMIALRINYKDVLPSSTNIDGSVVKLSGVSYKKIIDDNNPNNYKINWNMFNLNTKSLLAKVDYSVDKFEGEDDSIARGTVEKKSIEGKKTNRKTIIFILFGLIILAGILFFVTKKPTK